ncbi:hypothetical protein [Acidipropionibacterium jensenii]|uniref:hypothetical protein n=1 Tax=Acidipropionibacterium jensenii TaxID=1749 RepID=UPI0026471E7D|nr:hypothetical protein [Acidipropionibacterium jensenii]
MVPKDTQAFVEHEQKLGIDTTHHRAADADHGTIAYLALPALVSWLDAKGV